MHMAPVLNTVQQLQMLADSKSRYLRARQPELPSNCVPFPRLD